MGRLAHLYNTEVTVGRKTRPTSDGAGGFTETPGSAPDVPCRISPVSQAQRELGRREEGYLTHRLYCDEGADLIRGDVLTESATGRSFEVLTVGFPSVRGRHLQVDLEERKPGR